MSDNNQARIYASNIQTLCEDVKRLSALVTTLTRERDDARAALRDLVNSTSWIGEHCVIDQSPVVGSNGALDRAMQKLVEWEREDDINTSGQDEVDHQDERNAELQTMINLGVLPPPGISEGLKKVMEKWDGWGKEDADGS